MVQHLNETEIALIISPFSRPFSGLPQLVSVSVWRGARLQLPLLLLLLVLVVLGGLDDVVGRRLPQRRRRPDGRAQGQTAHRLGAAAGE